MHALALGIDERPFDMDPERAWHAFARLASGGQRRGKHARRVGDHRRQEGCHASAPMRGGDRSNSLNGRIGVEPHTAAAVDLPIDEAGAENSAAEIDLFATAGAVVEGSERLDRSALDNERAIVAQPFAVEDGRPIKNLHCAASLWGATTPPTSRIAPSVGS